MSSEAVYFSSRATVRFAIYPNGFEGARVLVEISKRALCDVFGAQDDGVSLIATYRAHFSKIQVRALSRYCHEPSVAVLLDNDDFATPGGTLATARKAERRTASTVWPAPFHREPLP
jgi:hypothetical protein